MALSDLCVLLVLRIHPASVSGSRTFATRILMLLVLVKSMLYAFAEIRNNGDMLEDGEVNEDSVQPCKYYYSLLQINSYLSESLQEVSCCL
jgi:hypothetical protein